MTAAANIRTHLDSTAVPPLKQHFKNHQCPVVNLHSLRLQSSGNLRTNLGALLPTIGVHRLFPLDYMNFKIACFVAGQVECKRPVPRSFHSFSVESLDLDHYPVQTLSVTRNWSAVAGHKVGDQEWSL